MTQRNGKSDGDGSIETVKTEELVLDKRLYPRHLVNDVHVNDIMNAMEAGIVMPPIIADRKSSRVVDGWHRIEAAKRLLMDEATVQVIWREYLTEGDLFLDAVRLNASHGRGFSNLDRVICVQRGEGFHVTREKLAGALGITKVRLDALTARKTALRASDGTKRPLGSNDADNIPADMPIIETIPIKSTIRHLANTELTAVQVIGNQKAGGMAQLRYINEVIRLFEYDILDWESERVIDRLSYLLNIMLNEDRLKVPAA